MSAIIQFILFLSQGRTNYNFTLSLVLLTSLPMVTSNLSTFKLQGLKSLAICCPNLSQLNLHGVHLQASNGKWQNTLIEVIAEFKHLVSLSVCACVLCQAGESKRVRSSVDFSGKLMKTGKRVSHCSSVRSVTQNELSCEGCFERTTKACREITEFELIRLSVPGLTFTKTHYDPVQCNASR